MKSNDKTRCDGDESRGSAILKRIDTFIFGFLVFFAIVFLVLMATRVFL